MGKKDKTTGGKPAKGGKPAAAAMDPIGVLDGDARIAEIDARIEEIGDPTAPRMKLGQDMQDLHAKHTAQREAMHKEVEGLQQALRDARVAEEPLVDEVAALKKERGGLVAAADAAAARADELAPLGLEE